jgi:hypothetical protein
MLSDSIINALQRIIDGERETFVELVAERFRNEVPLQEKLLAYLKPVVPDLVREKPYAQSGEKCDFWCPRDDGTESWVELKLCPTNYCKAFGDSKKSIAITQQIGQVILDCQKLSRIDARHERKVILLAYPMPVGNDHADWKTHTDWIFEHAQGISRRGQTVVRLGSAEAAINVYQIDV